MGDNSFATGYALGADSNENKGGMWGMNDGGAWIWIVLILALLGFGGGYGGFAGNAGTSAGYTLASDFATIQRQLSDGFGATEGKLDSISNGICSLGYDQLAQMNGINTNIMSQGNATQVALMQGFNGVQAGQTALATQLADCCCQNRYDSLLQTNGTQRLIENGFATAGYNAATNACAINTNLANATRDITDNQNANTRAILDAIHAQDVAAKDQKIADQAAQIQALTLAASQQAQNNYIVNQLKPQLPVAAYTVPNPFLPQCGYCGA